MRAGPLALLATLLLGAAPAPALEGVVYLDADADGLRDPGEVGIPGGFSRFRMGGPSLRSSTPAWTLER